MTSFSEQRSIWAFTYDVRYFWAFFDLPTFLVRWRLALGVRYFHDFSNLPTLKSDVICDCSLCQFFPPCFCARRIAERSGTKHYSPCLLLELKCKNLTSPDDINYVAACNFLKASMDCFKWYERGRYCRAVGTGGNSPTRILVDQLILPISTKFGRLCPPHYKPPPRIFRPCYGPGRYLLFQCMIS